MHCIKWGSCWLALALFAAPPAVAEIKRGQWEYTFAYRLTGVPQAFLPFTKSQCLSSEDAAPNIARRGYSCSHSRQKIEGDRVTWSVDCSGEEERVRGSGKMVHSGTSATGEVRLTIKSDNNPDQEMIYQIEGQYLGACKR